MRIVHRGMAIALAALSLAGSALAAPVETVLYSFQGGSDGTFAYAGLIADKEGALYGTTTSGGPSCNDPAGCGTVFKLTPPAKGQKIWTEAVLHSFTGYSSTGYSDGSFPTTGLIADTEGVLYGTTYDGGSRDAGTVFKLTPSTKGSWTETILYNFTGGSDGINPAAGLIADNQRALYGTTQFGGITACGGYGCGTVFKLTPPATSQKTWTESVLYSFTGGTDGGDPASGLIFDNQGALYSTTVQGGGSNGGTVFKLTPPATGQTPWTKTALYSFCSLSSCSDGFRPFARLLVDTNGALYSTTVQGGTGNYGTVFKLAPPPRGQIAWRETVVHSFKGGSDGVNPQAGLIADEEGALYSTTGLGGSSACGASGCGTVFKLTLSPDPRLRDDHAGCPVFLSQE